MLKPCAFIQAVFAPNLHNPRPPSPALQIRGAPSPAIHLFDPIYAEKRKKVHFVWCKLHLTLLSSAEFCKSRVEKREKTSKIDPNSTLFEPFSALFRHFFRSLSIR